MAAALTLTMAACSSTPGKPASTASSADSAAVSTSDRATSVSKMRDEPALFVVQEYLENQPLSRQRLYDHLLYLGYSEEEAEMGLDDYGADWVEVAKRALEGKDLQGDAAVEYLTGEGFTEEEAKEAVGK